MKKVVALLVMLCSASVSLLAHADMTQTPSGNTQPTVQPPAETATDINPSNTSNPAPTNPTSDTSSSTSTDDDDTAS